MVVFASLICWEKSQSLFFIKIKLIKRIKLLVLLRTAPPNVVTQQKYIRELYSTLLVSFRFVSSGSCPQGWIGHEGSCYIPFARSATWQEAEDTCKELDSHLVLSRSATENEFIAVEVGRPESRVWIGLRRIEGEFVWSDGKKADYTNWRRGEPKVASDCVSLLPEDIFHSWEVTNCDVMQAFICERGTKTVSFCWEKPKVYLECSPFKPGQVMCFHRKTRSNCLT